jgi:hypothetical protein
MSKKHSNNQSHKNLNDKVDRLMTHPMKHAVHTVTPGVLKKLLCASLIGALGAIAAPASAGVVTFDNVQNIVSEQLNAGDTAYNTGDAFTEGRFTMRVNNSATAASDEFGVVGALVDSNNAFACFVASCPTGNGSTYFAGLNDGVLNLSIAGAAGFRVNGLEYAFVAPTGGLPNFSYGQLVLIGTTAAGGTISMASNFPGQNEAGSFTFDQFMIDPTFRNTTLTGLAISACMFDDTGACNADREFTQNQAQFALDNLDLAVVPEPTSIALMLLGLAGLGTSARRRGNKRSK